MKFAVAVLIGAASATDGMMRTVMMTSDGAAFNGKYTYWTSFTETPAAKEGDPPTRSDFSFNAKCDWANGADYFKMADWKDKEIKCYVGLLGSKMDVCQLSYFGREQDGKPYFTSRDLWTNDKDSNNWWNDDSKL